MAAEDRDPACPVDARARDAWLAQAPGAATSSPHPSPPPPPPSSSWTRTLDSYLGWPAAPAADKKPPVPAAAAAAAGGLDTARAVSSIPRLSPGDAAAAAAPPASCPANHEAESGADAASGHWLYPSEKMFFDAMRRKGYDARTADMKTVVPIHNAVNERAWRDILAWEAPYLERSKCGGPRLASFAANKDRMTPTARLNTILGYAPPFDRHDWVVDRCGTRVEYVIDFYPGRPAGSRPGPSFYLDVRPKLNTREGLRMRARRWLGLA